MNIASELGKYTSIFFVLLIMGYALYKSIRRKQTIWIIVLSLNFIAGILLPGFLTIILPIIYFISNRKSKQISKN